MEKTKLKVRIFSTPACPYCVALKGYLKERNIEFEDIDVSRNLEAQKEMIERSGQYGVPVADINGEIIVGFNQERINQLLNLN
ncbi:MAG TPA: glutaredoxin domain-containing protein [Candidatus Portnoybacteria bacterium]|jgi:glutaredoxin 3|nr:glutaredoxin domain-containing protein [Candidatus Portnoybacteria bacterium]MDD5752029.1 glutaredoxin domain-containing protein [Candidatus Portnoybacteria bacterium]HNU96730.1 glutaredoxin domain-containing protein [Candidatus Portnoybacteria bacterium]HOZ16379.1 glutaredoxin domain-containing protein [Candidatus Portnoybacteria bacterium]HPH52071.1 glutaredoxin domain-containing protein [Candidatus Portnoybacteria bacterium]